MALPKRIHGRCAEVIPVLPKLVITFCAAAMAAHAEMPPLAVAGLVVFGCGFALADAFEKFSLAIMIGAVLGGLFSLRIPLRLFFGADVAFAAGLPQIACAAWAWGMVAAVSPFVPVRSQAKIRLPAGAALASGFVVASLWVGTAYMETLRLPFYLGILPLISLIVLCKRLFLQSIPGIQVANTCILLLAGIPAADLFWKAPEPAPLPSIAERFYSYELAKRDPVTFERWWSFFVGQSNEMLSKVLQKDGRRLALARTRPGAEAKLFESRVVINSLGFRGREIPLEKEDAFRIVALGESTTFGFTLEASDRPWPEVLESLIRQRPEFSREVQVINAGIPALNIHDNLRRFSADIARLKPDMILSYHGYNGFQFLQEAVPQPARSSPPTFQPRALRLLQHAEYRARLLLFRRARGAPPPRSNSDWGPLESTELARLYTQLYQAALEHDALLVLASFSMAANRASNPEVVRFYQLGFPSVAWSIEANTAHNQLVRTLADSWPDVLHVDTRPELDGCHEKFIDLVHLTQAGRDQIAEAFYTAIEPVLREKLSEPGSPASL